MRLPYDDLETAPDFLQPVASDLDLLYAPAAAAPIGGLHAAGAAAAPPSYAATAATTTSANPVIADMIAHEVNGALTYSGALAVLRDFKAKMTTTLFSQLVAAANDLNVNGGVTTSAYVQQMFDNVVLGNPANANWNGGANTAAPLGNLSATSTKAQYVELINKWFLGQDLPGDAPAPGQADSYATAYQKYTLPLFSPGGPKLTDVNQGQVGDCWYLAALAETAMQDPSLIRKLITNNGNGTFSVEFQVNGQADYVTVNKMLPYYTDGLGQYNGSNMEFANSTSNLWVELFEKALAQLSEQGVATGLDYPGGANQYYELTGGDGEGITLLTGQTASDYSLSGQSGSSLTTLLGQMQSDLAAGYDVLLGTSGQSVSGNLVADHMFAVTAINAAAGTVTLYNPWGANAVGENVAASFTISASALVADQADFVVASGAKTVA